MILRPAALLPVTVLHVAALAALTGPAAAFEIDYARVFAETPEAITRTGETTRQADLPGNVHVVETTASDGSVSYFGYDDSPAGAAGCPFRILVEVLAVAGACPQLLSAEESATLAGNLAASADFVGTNTVPPIPREEIAARLRSQVEDSAAKLAATGMTCPAPDDPELMPIVRTVASPAFARMLAQIHAVPRLPVANPCL